ncbi:hypothetical protein HOLleu_03068 [Holothuria leucospilota]|uniref:Uncharacterized protein n=1 Tax=Holothuria leucospilota TaxID=206669 RepID=A0A9Q1HK30_HOLLE|nr:hypothetical protein HOLleu_03068 [Holothuria leucospilota]
MASTSAPYQTAIRGKIIAIGPEKDFITSSGEPRKFTQLGLATREKAIKVFHYAPEKIRMIKEGNCVLIKNCNSRQDGHITLNSTSIMYMRANIDIPQAIIQDAKQLIHPPEARLVTIQEANASPVKSTVTLQGFITQDENVRSVNVGGRATAVRGMTLEDKTGKIRLSLWREKATSPIKIGDFVEATNLAITKFNSESTAGSTARTLIKVIL